MKSIVTGFITYFILWALAAICVVGALGFAIAAVIQENWELLWWSGGSAVGAIILIAIGIACAFAGIFKGAASDFKDDF